MLIALPAVGVGHAMPGAATVTSAATPSRIGASMAASSAGVPAAPLPPDVERFVILPGESTVAYRVGETLLAQTARWRAVVGVTNALGGEIFITRANPGASHAGAITVDMTQLRSDNDRRDSALRTRWLETARFPTAEFTLSEIRGMPRVFPEGREVTVQLVGSLKIRDVARPAGFAAILSLEGVTLRGVAGTTIRMTDFGIQPPSLLGVARAEDDVALEVRFTAERSR